MKAHAYVLRSRTDRYYYGSTNDLARRLAEHQRGKTATTAKDGPWTLVGSIEVDSMDQARRLERQFKRWKSPARVAAWLGHRSR